MSDRGEPAKEDHREGDEAEDELALCDGCGGGGGSGGGVRDDEGARRNEKRGSSSSSSKRRKAKQALLFPVKKFKKLCLRSSGEGERRTKRTLARAPTYDAVGTGCVLCFSAPPIPPDSPLRVDDRQKKHASYDDFVRSLLEKNDFYSPDCNVHRPFNDR